MLGLLGVALTTMAAAWTQGESTAFVGAVLRAGAGGVFSAWALVCISSWCLAELARRRTPQLGAPGSIPGSEWASR